MEPETQTPAESSPAAAETQTRAESSPAPASTPAAPAERQKIEIPRDPAGYAEWRKTGKFPEAKKDQPKPDAAAASKENSETAPSAESGETKQEPRPAQPRRNDNNAQTRLNEILADLKRAGFTPAELKNFRREAQQAAPPARQTPEPPATKPAAADPQPPTKPQMSDFADYGEYETALEQWQDKMADYRVEKKFRERDEREREQRQQSELNQRLSDAAARYGEAAGETVQSAAHEVYADADVPVAVKELLGGSPVLVDLLYVMGSKPEDLRGLISLAKSDPAAAIRKIVVTEQFVQDELKRSGKPDAGAAPRNEAGQFAKQEPPPARKTTQAPPPPSELSGRASAPEDAVKRAVAAKDFDSYRRLANERDLRRTSGR